MCPKDSHFQCNLYQPRNSCPRHLNSTTTGTANGLDIPRTQDLLSSCGNPAQASSAAFPQSHHTCCFGEQNWIQGTVNIIAFVESLWVYTTQSLALQACDYTHQEQRECEITACLSINLYNHHQFPQNMPNMICIQSGLARKHLPEVGWMTLAHQLASRLDLFH